MHMTIMLRYEYYAEILHLLQSSGVICLASLLSNDMHDICIVD